MKNIIRYFVICCIQTWCIAVFATTDIYFTNRTPYTLEIDVRQIGSHTLPQSDYKLKKSSVGHGETADIFTVNRDVNVESDDIYEFLIGVTIPKDTNVSESHPITLWLYLKLKGTWDGSDMWYAAKIDKIFDDNWISDGKKVHYFTRDNIAHFKKTPTNEGFELEYYNKGTAGFDDLQYNLIWYADNWKYQYPDAEGDGSEGTSLFEKIKQVVKGVSVTVDEIKLIVKTWEDLIKKIENTYVPDIDKTKDIGDKIKIVAKIIPEVVSGVTVIQEAIAKFGYYIIQPFDEKAYKNIKNIVNQLGNILQMINETDTLLPSVADLIDSIEQQFNATAQKHIATLKERNYVGSGSLSIITNASKTNYSILDSAGKPIYTLPAGATKAPWKDFRINGQIASFSKLYNSNNDIIFKADNGEDIIIHGDKNTRIITISKKVKTPTGTLQEKTFVTLDMNKLAQTYVHPNPTSQELNSWSIYLGISENSIDITQIPVYIDRIANQKYYQDYIAISPKSASGRQDYKNNKNNKPIDSLGFCGQGIVKQSSCE